MKKPINSVDMHTVMVEYSCFVINNDIEVMQNMRVNNFLYKVFKAEFTVKSVKCLHVLVMLQLNVSCIANSSLHISQFVFPDSSIHRVRHFSCIVEDPLHAHG